VSREPANAVPGEEPGSPYPTEWPIENVKSNL
jgi:hypothetical protein